MVEAFIRVKRQVDHWQAMSYEAKINGSTAPIMLAKKM
jgi:hypothetical protein